MRSRKLEFDGENGAKLAARLDLPQGKPRAFALFAHCFTCSKDLNATRRIAVGLAEKGIAVLRFDFTGLGSSEGEFASTNFSSNVADLLRACEMLRKDFEAPSLMIGHSLGGAAVLVAAGQVPEVRGVVTIGAPADASHVLHSFAAKVETIETEGKAEVHLAGRAFTIEKQFLDDLSATSVKQHISALKKPLLVFHSPIDQIVGIENAAEIFMAAKHPKSFISLDHADHLLSKDEDARFVAAAIAAWSERYLPQIENETETEQHQAAIISETGASKFQNTVMVGKHHLMADEPVSFGGANSGLSPYDFLSAGLGACTNMTLRMYVERKKWDVGLIEVEVSHEKIHAADCLECSQELKDSNARIDIFHRKISVKAGLDREIVDRLAEIADKCPVHKTLHGQSRITTTVVTDL